MKYKNIIYQFLAGLCLMIGIKQFFIFVDLDLIELIAAMGKESFAYYADKTDKLGISSKITQLVQAKAILGYIAIAINYFILFTLAFKKRLNWNISLGVTIVLIVLHFFKIGELSPISFIQMHLVAAYIVPAIIALTLAGFLYLLSFRTSSK